jgi:hypothetical protein
VDSAIGLHGFESVSNTGGGFFTNCFNNILFGNVNAIVTETNTFIEVHHSDISGINWPGTNNINADPLFVDAPNRNYRLAPLSPARGNGLGGTHMGIAYPVGGIPPEPSHVMGIGSSNSVVLSWSEGADNEDGFILSRSTNRSDWMVIGMAATNATSYVDANLSAGRIYYYRVRATNACGLSPWSPVFRGLTTEGLGDDDGDGMPNHWERIYGFDPDFPGDGFFDADGDGLLNEDEYIAGTHPLDASSFLRLWISAFSPDVYTLSFYTATGRTYHIQSASNLWSGVWEEVCTNISGIGSILMKNQTKGAQRLYYRLEVGFP